MRCPACGGFLPDGTSCCPYCGSPVFAVKSSPKVGGGAGLNVVASPKAGEGIRLNCMPSPEAVALEKENGGADVFDNCIDGILELICEGKNNTRWFGSGFIVTQDGYAVTNAHVAANEEDGSPVKNGKITVKVCNSYVRAKVIALADDKAGRGNGIDLAVIKLDQMPSGSKALQIEDYSTVRNGEQIYVIGNSLGEGTCITSGIVSDKNHKGHLMFDCPSNGGNSGGPIINSEGKVIGVLWGGRLVPAKGGSDNMVMVGAEGMNFAVPSNILLEFLKKTINYK